MMKNVDRTKQSTQSFDALFLLDTSVRILPDHQWPEFALDVCGAIPQSSIWMLGHFVGISCGVTFSRPQQTRIHHQFTNSTTEAHNCVDLTLPREEITAQLRCGPDIGHSHSIQLLISRFNYKGLTTWCSQCLCFEYNCFDCAWIRWCKMYQRSVPGIGYLPGTPTPNQNGYHARTHVFVDFGRGYNGLKEVKI